MEIYEPQYEWTFMPGTRKETRYIVLHHAGGEGSAEAVHDFHRFTRGWAGIAYHYYVRRSGQICRGRAEEWSGGHARGYNNSSVGVCFEGDFEYDTMPAAQLAAGKELIKYLRGKYPAAEIVPHGRLNATDCPGENFPFEQLQEEGESTMYRTLNDVPEHYRDAIQSLMEKGALVGRADPEPDSFEDNILDISEDYCRVMATLHKLGMIK